MRISTNLRSAARRAANAVTLEDRVGWREAMALANFSSASREQERAYRRAFAERLVERGLARPAGAPKPDRARGEHTRDRIKVSYTEEQRARWERAAKGTPLSRWLAGLADRAS